MTHDATLAVLAFAAALLLFAALHDIAVRTIPNWVPAALAVAGGAARVLDQQWALGLACSLAVFAAALFCWQRGWLGGGDVKLLAAATLLLRPELVPGYVAATALAGGVLALTYLALARIVPVPRLRPGASLLRRLLAVECRRIRRRAPLPYAAAIGTAAILMLSRA